MTDPARSILTPAPGYRSVEVGSFVAQMDDQSRRLGEDTRTLTPEALAWQPAPGMNTMGMLLAHNAIVEVFWTTLVLENREKPIPYLDILRIGENDDGMPQRENGRPPTALDGKGLSFFDDLLGRARANLKRVAKPLSDSDLEVEISRKRDSGEIRIFNRRWALYHLLEHYAGHYGQILLLKHHFSATHPGA